MSLTRNALLAFAAISAAAAFAAPASANTVFDSQALGEPLCVGNPNCVTETRGAQGNYASVLQFSENVSVNQIGVWSSVGGDQDVKFVIFDSLLNGGTGNLLFSDTEHFASNENQAWLYTGIINFTFQAGHTYDVGILGTGETLTGRWIAYQDLTDGPVTEIARNANINFFNSPGTGNYAGVSPWVQLNSGAVPEPASWALMITGLGLTGAALRRRPVRVAVTA